jgi:uncharacterized caspase-like protein
MAQRADATTVEIRASHVAMMSQPHKVAAVIEQAANNVS